MEVIETVITITEIADLLKSIFDSDGDGEVISQELIDVIDSFGNGEAGDNDIETLLVDIKSSLTYNEDYTALQEISSRLELMDTRLDTEFTVLNSSIGFIATGIITIFVWKFFSWIARLASV